MANLFKTAPRRRRGSELNFGEKENADSDSGVFDTSLKNASVKRFQAWRIATLVLNASRRFQYCLDLKNVQAKEVMRHKIRSHVVANLAANRFLDMGNEQDERATPPDDFGVGPEQLMMMSKDHNICSLQQYGGVQGLSKLLNTNTEKGINGEVDDLLKRKNTYGSNIYPRKKIKCFMNFLWEASQDLKFIILMVVAIASLALGIKTEGIKEGWCDGVSTIIAIIVVIAVTAVSHYKQSLLFQNLNDEKMNIHLEVIRGGTRVEIQTCDIVVGDVIPLNIGNQVPADGVLIAGHSIALDESSMTGKSKIVNKDPNKDPFLVSGCKVADGNGVMLVTSVGVNTEWGLLMASISQDNSEKTPLKVLLKEAASVIGISGSVLAVAVLVILLVRYFSGHTRNSDGTLQFVKGETKAVEVIKSVSLVIAVVVLAVPEGLKLAETIVLAFSMKKLMADKALVRKLSACEKMGSATTICCDKTGTLTLNQMMVVESYAMGKKSDSSKMPATITSLVFEGIAQNTTGSVHVPEGGGDLDFFGSPTEKAIHGWGLELGMNVEAARSQSSILHVFPFNSEKKRGGVAVKTADGEVHVHWKGASEVILASCRSYIDEDGNVAPMTEDKAHCFKNGIQEMAGKTLRCVALAFRTYEVGKLPRDEELLKWVLPEDDLILLAIVGIKDPCRPGVKDSVPLCQNAGVKVRMVTGDDIQTAKAIALDCGILTDVDALAPNLIEGEVFSSLSEAERDDISEDISVMGRSSPNDKLLLVQSLRRRGHVVAFIGDGTNDALALHEADIALAMGAGTEVAKVSSDIIILDDNFASVVKVFRWGRSIYSNIQRFTHFQITGNFTILVIYFVAIISSGDFPFKAVQLLWVNLIMDTLGALAFAAEPPTDQLMARPPVGRNREPPVINIMWRDLLIQAIYQVAVLLVLNFRGISLLNLEHNVHTHASNTTNTLIFNAFVFCQAFNGFNARKPDEKNIFKGLIKNRLFMGIIFITIFLQVIIVEYLGKFSSTMKLNWKQWLICVVIGFISWPLAFLGKFIPVPRTPFSSILAQLIFWCREKASTDVGEKPTAPATSDFGIGVEQLVQMSREENIGFLQQYGGVQGLSNLLKSNTEKGIHGDDDDLLKRIDTYGSNTYPRKKGKSFLRFLWDACQDLTLIILMVTAVASLALGIKTEGFKEGWYDGGSIAFALILVIVVTAVSDYKQCLHFENLIYETRNIHLEVIRSGRRVKISIYDIVVGDVIPLNIGNQVPADGVLIAGYSLALDESSMTGESKIVNKDVNRNPFLMSGCKVADGNGVMLVTCVGVNTEWGLLMASISEGHHEETHLQVRLNGVATFIGIIGLAVAVCLLVFLLVRYFTGHTKEVGGGPQFVKGKTKIGHVFTDIIKVFTLVVTIVVVAVPEGLPLAVTLTLAYSVRKMMADKALVRRLSACETMGSATTICSHKTGTITLNQMTVVESYTGGKKTDTQQFPATITSLVFEGIAQNTTGSIYAPEGGGDLELSGSPTEKAILGWGIKLGMNFEATRSQSSILHVFPFNSEKKRSSVAVKMADGEVHVHWKGASEIVLASCRSYIDEDGNVAPMTEDKAQYFSNGTEEMAGRTLRCVALAYRPYEPEKVPTGTELSNWVLPEDDLILLAILGIKDPCRAGVENSVQLCQSAGVKVRMISGDSVQTAKAIALECGILTSDADASERNLIEGKSFRAMTDAERDKISDKISVMGRSSPIDKLLLVQSLRRLGHVVAVTGDGTDDAPALHEADIGLAMGIAGTEVAKESSDIIILDDNFASVVKVVRWGRSVYANIQKFIQFQLTVNVAALVINVVAAISSGDVPLTAVQLLWVNLLMDTLGALALATEPPTDHLMGRPPVGRKEPLITNIMWKNLLIQAIYQVSVLSVLYSRGISILGLGHESPAIATRVKNTMIFNTFVLCQAFNEFNARKPDEKNIFKGVIKNRLFMGIIVITLVIQVIIIEFLGKFASTTKLNWKQWLICVAIGVISWPLALVGKLIPVPKTPLSSKLWGKKKTFRRR